MSKRLTSGLAPSHSATGGPGTATDNDNGHPTSAHHIEEQPSSFWPVFNRPTSSTASTEPGKIRPKRNHDTSTKKNKTKRTTSSHSTRDDKQRAISDITKFFPNVQKTNTARINSDDDFEMGDPNVGALFFTICFRIYSTVECHIR
jgi:hypothetical protein